MPVQIAVSLLSALVLVTPELVVGTLEQELVVGVLDQKLSYLMQALQLLPNTRCTVPDRR
jgi:hypothetical protein